MYDVSPRKNYEQIAATGHNIRDVKAVLMGHLRKLSRWLLLLGIFTKEPRCRCGSFGRINAFHRHRRAHLRP